MSEKKVDPFCLNCRRPVIFDDKGSHFYYEVKLVTHTYYKETPYRVQYCACGDPCLKKVCNSILRNNWEFTLRVNRVFF